MFLPLLDTYLGRKGLSSAVEITFLACRRSHQGQAPAFQFLKILRWKETRDLGELLPVKVAGAALGRLVLLWFSLSKLPPITPRADADHPQTKRLLLP